MRIARAGCLPQFEGHLTQARRWIFAAVAIGCLPASWGCAEDVLVRPQAGDAAAYRKVLAEIGLHREALALRYRRATAEDQRAEVLDLARAAIVASLADRLFPYWHGTRWNFYGDSESPGHGTIACGYFVSTLLRDVGFGVERVRLAQQASERIILSLTREPHVKRYSRVAIGDFVQAVRGWGEGLYVVGLDVHTGFILNRAGEITFVHSSYRDPQQVIEERAADSPILASSQYRVLGRLTADDELIIKWLYGNKLPTRMDLP